MENNNSTFDLPYFDSFFNEVSKKNATLEKLLGRNVHWGYWEDPSKAEVSADDFMIASDNLTRQLIKHASLTPNSQILDVGCGFGGTIALLNEEHTGLNMTGLNIDPRQIERAKTKVLPSIKKENSANFIVGDACELPFASSTFDTVFAVECIFHFPSRERFFKEAARVLKPGGKLILSDFVVNLFLLPVAGFYYLFYHKDVTAIYGKRNSIASRSLYQKLAKKSGFTVDAMVDITSHTLPTYPVIEMYSELFSDNPTGFSRANRYLEIISKRRALRYEVLSFKK
jgi:ubiquinone/menaquinone biosynthesis C-methylase UbiE